MFASHWYWLYIDVGLCSLYIGVGFTLSFASHWCWLHTFVRLTLVLASHLCSLHTGVGFLSSLYTGVGLYSLHPDVDFTLLFVSHWCWLHTFVRFTLVSASHVVFFTLVLALCLCSLHTGVGLTPVMASHWCWLYSFFHIQLAILYRLGYVSVISWIVWFRDDQCWRSFGLRLSWHSVFFPFILSRVKFWRDETLFRFIPGIAKTKAKTG